MRKIASLVAAAVLLSIRKCGSFARTAGPSGCRRLRLPDLVRVLPGVGELLRSRSAS